MMEEGLVINNCPGTLTTGFNTYSPKCLRKLFGGKKVSHFLTFNNLKDEWTDELFFASRKRASISGVQQKISFVLDNRDLRPINQGEQGTYILKPIPRDLHKVDQVPANEHLSMQIAQQVFGLETAENCLVFFKNGEPAYLTKRFDMGTDGSKKRQEDFATLAGKSSDSDGPDYKYNYSYEEIGGLIKQYLPAWRIEMPKFFALLIFNYLISNRDAHLKNFSILETPSGDFRLSPAYDLINTHLHVDDSDFALDRGLFADNFQSPYRLKRGHASKSDFLELARRLEIKPTIAQQVLHKFVDTPALLLGLIERSFLSEKNKRAYLQDYRSRLDLLLEK
jgi:serine/threonine-protein kinase HipA